MIVDVVKTPPKVGIEVTDPWWDTGIDILTLILVIAGVLGVIWKIAKPHVKRYIESVVQPLHEKAESTHHQLTTNHHVSEPATVLDRVDSIGKTVDAIASTVESNTAQIGQVRRDLGVHETEGRQMLATAVRQLQAQGVTLHIEHDDQERGTPAW